jgi:hypothetical protein
MNRNNEQAPPGGNNNDRPPDGRQRNSYIPSFLFISFALFMLTNHNSDEYLARHKYRDAIASLTQQSANFTSWLNGTVTNFTLVKSFYYFGTRNVVLITYIARHRCRPRCLGRLAWGICIAARRGRDLLHQHHWVLPWCIYFPQHLREHPLSSAGLVAIGAAAHARYEHNGARREARYVELVSVR